MQRKERRCKRRGEMAMECRNTLVKTVCGKSVLATRAGNEVICMQVIRCETGGSKTEQNSGKWENGKKKRREGINSGHRKRAGKLQG